MSQMSEFKKTAMGECVLSSQQQFASEIVPNLYLGNCDNAVNKSLLAHYKIKKILNVANELPPPLETYEELGIECLHIGLRDNSEMSLSDRLEIAVEYIHQAIIADTPILVHCKLGVSRSATVVIAYLITHGLNTDASSKMSYEDAFDHVLNIRPIIMPNFGFVIELRKMDGSNVFAP